MRANLHVVLCFSPVGDAFRSRCRRFPGLINCTQIDWFRPWPRDALVKVSMCFLDDMDLGDDEVLKIHSARTHAVLGKGIGLIY